MNTRQQLPQHRQLSHPVQSRKIVPVLKLKKIFKYLRKPCTSLRSTRRILPATLISTAKELNPPNGTLFICPATNPSHISILRPAFAYRRNQRDAPKSTYQIICKTYLHTTTFKYILNIMGFGKHVVFVYYNFY